MAHEDDKLPKQGESTESDDISRFLMPFLSNDSTAAVLAPAAVSAPAPASIPNHDREAEIKLNKEVLRLRGLHTELTGVDLAVMADNVKSNPLDYMIHTFSSVTFEPFYFFFYGSLQVPVVLNSVLRADPDAKLDMKPGSIKDWEIMRWGPYPALVPNTGNKVSGMYWKCEQPLDVLNLCRYETKAYRLEYCDITTEEGDVIKDGRTFVATVHRSKLEVGSFDLDTFRRQHGGLTHSEGKSHS
ncbi:hypothetical protein F4781DRAFT_394818 [Annulohypoxylon bovei var. microspora]|nr:hypothetical protein F4781DRAFT_394818 [Annulohypoxylon bovei var. microspora]